jgi:tellurite resistance protein TehA-like permease
MRTFQIYRNIRKRALIFGLPVSLFALQMAAVIGSLLMVIFSFSLLLVMAAIAINLMLYVLLLKLTHQPQILHIQKVFPTAISNKKTTVLHYED